MSGIVQSISGVVDTPTNFGLAFAQQVTQGNLLLCAVQSNGQNITGATDPADNVWQVAAPETTEDFSSAILYTIAKTNANGLKVTPTIAAPQQDIHIHLYEVAGYDTLDQANGNVVLQSSNPLSISTSAATKHIFEFVLAVFNDFENTGGPTQAWVGQPGNQGTLTTNNPDYFTSMFTEVFEVGSMGVQTATATSISNPESDEQMIAAFYSSRGGGGGFLVYPPARPARYVQPRPKFLNTPIYRPK
jgi:hypothetical protein